MSLFPVKLVVVTGVFAISRGLLVFTPSVPYALAKEIRLRAGDRLELRRPDGTILETTLHGLARGSPSDGALGISIKCFTKADVPIDTEIWKVG